MTQGRHEALIARLRALAETVAASVGVEVVEIGLRGSSRKRLLRVDIDRPGTAGVGLADCEHMSRSLERFLDEQDFMQGGYVLEVSSPGADRPIRTDDDFRRNAGRRVVVEVRDAIEGARQIRGVLLGAEPGAVRVHTDRGELSVPREVIEVARQDLGF